MTQKKVSTENIFLEFRSLNQQHDPKNFALTINELDRKTNDLNHLESGLLYSQYVHLVWGKNDKLLSEFFHKALARLNSALKEVGTFSWHAILILQNQITLLSLMLPALVNTENDNNPRTDLLKIKQELAERQITLSSKLAKNSIVVNGFKLKYDFKSLSLEFIETNYEVNGGSTFMNNSSIIYECQGAFDILFDLSDYTGCSQIADFAKSEFLSYRQQGNLNAMYGWLNPIKGSHYFKLAHEAFAQDTRENSQQAKNRHRLWTSSNTDLIAPYYKSLHYLSLASEDSNQSLEYIHMAANELSDCPPYFDARIRRYTNIIKAVSSCLLAPDIFKMDEYLRKYMLIWQLGGTEPEDISAIEFIVDLKETLTSMVPRQASQMLNPRLAQIVKNIDRIATFSQNAIISQNLTEAICAKAGEICCQGPTSWIHRKLESIKQEANLRKILLGLFRAQNPDTARIIHGTLEHGRDIIVLRKKDGELILELFQVKIGDINTQDWRQVKPQLEESMEVCPPESFNATEKPDKKIGILVFNGHIKPLVMPKVLGWIKSRQENMNEKYEIMDIDRIVSHIIDNCLTSEFREVLKEIEE